MGLFKKPTAQKVYRSTTEPQGPIQLPGGTTGYLLPLPTSSATPAATPTPGTPQGSADPGGAFAGGWIFGSPVAGDMLDANHVEVAASTREGYVFLFDTAGAAGTRQWPTFHHDNWNSGNVTVDPAVAH